MRAGICFGLDLIHHLVTRYPISLLEAISKEHLVGLSVIPNLFRKVKYTWSWATWSLALDDLTNMSFI